MIADALAALADPTRRRVFELVADRPGPVGRLADQLPVSRPAVSQHLKVLREAGLVQEERVGTRHVYRLETAGLELLRSYFESFWERSLAAFKEAVEHASPPGPSDPPSAEEAP